MSLHHGLVEGEYSLHALGGRDAFDPISQILVASSPKGWHCPQVRYTPAYVNTCRCNAVLIEIGRSMNTSLLDLTCPTE